MQTLRSFRHIVDGKTLIIAVLAILSTYWSGRVGLTADFPLTLIGIAVVFPLVFSIGGAYKRREAALGNYGSMKAHGRAIYFAARDWLPESDEATQENARQVLGDLFRRCRELFQAPVPEMNGHEERVYREFSRLSTFIKGFRGRGLATGEVSRCNQYLSKMLGAFEGVKHIYQYRTPRTLKAYSRVFIYLLPILYGPYFAQLSGELSDGVQYVMPVLFAVVLVSLANIQDHLENPFDQIGEDDVTINAEKFVARLATE
jgi:predicted membrane chloride channel (bestrophin family)